MSIERIKEARDHLREFRDSSRTLATAGAAAQELEEQLDWEVRTLEHRPVEAPNYSSTGLDERSEDLLRRVKSLFPALPEVDLAAIATATSITTSTASTTVSYVMRIAEVGTPGARTFATRALREYREIQDRQQRPNEVRGMLLQEFPALVARFDDAIKAYGQYRSGHADATAVALLSRTFLDGLQGELIDRARGHPKEGISIQVAVSRLFAASPNVADVEYEIDHRGELIGALSSVAKGRKTPSQPELDGLWSRVLDHAIVVLLGFP